MPPSLPHSVHRQFHVHQCLGRGGYGEVYHATMVNVGGLKTEVAIKLLHADAGLDEQVLARLKDEGRLLSLLHHPSILRVYDLADIDGRIGLVTEYVPGIDLHHAIRDLTPPLNHRGLLEVTSHVAEALREAYEVDPQGTGPLRLIHRDIKPGNIRIGRHGEVKLLDFGVASSADIDRQARTLTHTALGSLPYMAPERFAKIALTGASDIYSLGCCLFEGFVGERIHGDQTPVELFGLASDESNHQAFIRERLQQLTLAVDPLARLLLEDMLSHDPTLRPSGSEVSKRCSELLLSTPGASLRTWVQAQDLERVARNKGALTGRTFIDGRHEEPSPSIVSTPQADPPDAPQATLSSPGPSDLTLRILWRTGMLCTLGFVVLWVLKTQQIVAPVPTVVPPPLASPSAEITAPRDPPRVFVAFAGDVRDVELRHHTGRIVSWPGGDILAGRYDLYANFVGVYQWVSKANLQRVDHVTITCDRASRSCDVQR